MNIKFVQQASWVYFWIRCRLGTVFYNTLQQIDSRLKIIVNIKRSFICVCKIASKLDNILSGKSCFGIQVAGIEIIGSNRYCSFVIICICRNIKSSRKCYSCFMQRVAYQIVFPNPCCSGNVCSPCGMNPSCNRGISISKAVGIAYNQDI